MMRRHGDRQDAEYASGLARCSLGHSAECANHACQFDESLMLLRSHQTTPHSLRIIVTRAGCVAYPPGPEKTKFF